MIVAALLPVTARSGTHVVGTVRLAGPLRVMRIAATSKAQPPHGLYQHKKENAQNETSIIPILIAVPNREPKHHSTPENRGGGKGRVTNKPRTYLRGRCQDRGGRHPGRSRVRTYPLTWIAGGGGGGCRSGSGRGSGRFRNDNQWSDRAGLREPGRIRATEGIDSDSDGDRCYFYFFCSISSEPPSLRSALDALGPAFKTLSPILSWVRLVLYRSQRKMQNAVFIICPLNKSFKTVTSHSTLGAFPQLRNRHVPREATRSAFTLSSTWFGIGRRDGLHVGTVVSLVS